MRLYWSQFRALQNRFQISPAVPDLVFHEVYLLIKLKSNVYVKFNFICNLSASQRGAGKEGTCPKPWKGLTGFCDKMGDQCGMDYHCGENEKCCFSGCQRMCVNTTEAHKKRRTKPGQCPKPWLGHEGLCDRRGDMCLEDVDCKGSQICCLNGCQNDCVNPG